MKIWRHNKNGIKTFLSWYLINEQPHFMTTKTFISGLGVHPWTKEGSSENILFILSVIQNTSVFLQPCPSWKSKTMGNPDFKSHATLSVFMHLNHNSARDHASKSQSDVLCRRSSFTLPQNIVAIFSFKGVWRLVRLCWSYFSCFRSSVYHVALLPYDNCFDLWTILSWCYLEFHDWLILWNNMATLSTCRIEAHF